VTWLRVWARAVIVPAGRRVSAAWVGCAIVGSQILGGNAMRPSDLTGLALHHAGVGAVMAVTWVFVFLPTARVLVRQDGARYLRALPAPRWTPTVIAAAALVGLQGPWIGLWIVGEGGRGAAIGAVGTLVIAGLAAIRTPVLRPRAPTWGGPMRALAGVHVRALRRRAGDALLRGIGLAALAGAAGGLFVRNNELAGAAAAVLGSAVIAVMLVPAVVAPLLVLLESHRASAWVAATTGASELARLIALAAIVVGVQLVGTVIAVGAAAALIGTDGQTIAWLAGVAGLVAVGSGLGCTRVLLGVGDATRVAARASIGALGVAAAAVLCLGLFEAAGALGLVAIGLAALLARSPS
jgi:hypothetical protein